MRMCICCTEATPPEGGLRMGYRTPWVRRWFLVVGVIASVAFLLPGPVLANDTLMGDSLFTVEQHVDEEWQQFTHLTVDKNTGAVYAGGVNHLYQFDQDLQLLHHVVTGPVYDSVECSANGCSEGSNGKLTGNVNKVLVIDYTKRMLIVCGTFHQGSCQVRDLSNISVLDRNVSEPIVANNETASTVAFIAPGPPLPPTTHVLYIGVTYTGNSVYRHEIPAIASRSLEDDKFFEIAVTDVTTSTSMYVNSLAFERYPITYVYGFGSDNFSYFLTKQADSTNTGAPFISKLVRVCQNDSAYYSYTEIPIVCKASSGRLYNLVQAAYIGKPGPDLATQMGIQTNDDVLFAVFSPSEGSEGSAKPAAESALCVYSMESVRRMFMHNIQNCFRGRGDRGLNFISPSHKCVEVRIDHLNEDFCGMDINTPLGGEQPVESVAALTFPVRLTAIAATSSEDYTVVFLGTTQGHLKKVVIEDQTRAMEYGDIVVDESSSVRQDMFFDKAGDHLYVMTSNKISKVKVQDCSVYNDCNQCLEPRDPYCGWCSLENKCSLRRDCRDDTQDPQHWVSYETGNCTTITQVKPNKLQRTTARTLSLMIDNMPSVEGDLQCVFSTIHKDLITKAKRTAQGVSCTTPRNDFLPSIPHNEHSFVATLSVRKQEGPKFANTNFTFFDCNTYSSCTECVSSPFPCDWCVDGHRCTHDSAENCRNDILVNGVNQVSQSIRSGPSFCPRITFIESQEILVPSGNVKSVRVKVDNIAQFIIQTRFVCQYNLLGRVTSVNAQLLGDTIYCDEWIPELNNYKAPTTIATIAVIWGGSKPLDNPDNIHVLVYQCHQMADNCGMCGTLPEKFNCNWCQSTGKCESEYQCPNPASWITRNQTCTDITITDFHPKSGPWEGGTNVTITGVNLGKDISDIYEGITVAGIHCQPFRETYVKTKEVTCMVDSPGVNDFKQGPIVVKAAEGYRGESAEMYQFVNPEITDLWPTEGPKSGGTTLHIIGRYMNAGSHITAAIGGRPCIIQRTNATETICITTASNNLMEGKVEMQFDYGKRNLEGKYYRYLEDPEITSVKSGRAGQLQQRNGPQGIPAGGIIITVDGQNFNVINEPKMYVEYNETRYLSPCDIKSATRMECQTPKISTNNKKQMRLPYGFIMNEVKGVMNLNKRDGFDAFLLYPNPNFYKFKNEDREKIKQYNSKTQYYLTIEGKNLNHVFQKEDIEVRVGAEFCNVTSLSRNQLTCKPPKEQPTSTNNENTFPEVIVIAGGNLPFEIGYLKYTGTNTTNVGGSCDGTDELREEVAMLKTVIYDLKDMINHQHELLMHMLKHLPEAPDHTHVKDDMTIDSGR